MPTKLQASGVVSRAQNSPLGPGIALFDCVEFTPTGILNALAGDTAYGVNVGLLTSPPSFNLGTETVNILDNVVGGMPSLKGAIQIESQEVTMECEFAQINRENLEMAMPGLTTADWTSAAHASVVAGTGNAAIKLTALTSGTGPNTNYTFVVATPAGGTTTVAVTGTLPARVITVTPATGATVNQVVRAINANADANDIVHAGRPSTSNGTGALLAASSQAFAGGTAGSVIGEVFTHPGYITSADYRRNFVAAFETANTRLGYILRVDNVISMDDFSFQAEDSQVLSGVGMTLTATVDESAYNSTTGTYTPPFSWYRLADVAV